MYNLIPNLLSFEFSDKKIKILGIELILCDSILSVLVKVKCHITNSIYIFYIKVILSLNSSFCTLLLSYTGIGSHLIRNNRNMSNSPKSGLSAVRFKRNRFSQWGSMLEVVGFSCTYFSTNLHCLKSN